jgi:hypothetical protein
MCVLVVRAELACCFTFLQEWSGAEVASCCIAVQQNAITAAMLCMLLQATAGNTGLFCTTGSAQLNILLLQLLLLLGMQACSAGSRCYVQIEEQRCLL